MNVTAESTGDDIVLNDTIHQATRLRIMAVLVSVPEADRLAYGFIQETLGLTGGNLTIHLRKLQQASYVQITKEFHGPKPRNWVQATTGGRRSFAEYLSNRQRALNFQPPQPPQATGPTRNANRLRKPLGGSATCQEGCPDRMWSTLCEAVKMRSSIGNGASAEEVVDGC